MTTLVLIAAGGAVVAVAAVLTLLREVVRLRRANANLQRRLRRHETRWEIRV